MNNLKTNSWITCRLGTAKEVCVHTCTPKARKLSHIPLSLLLRIHFLTIDLFPSLSLSLSPLCLILPFPMLTQGLVTSLMKEIAKQILYPPRLNSFIALHPSAPSIPLRSQTSATHPFPAVQDCFPVWGKENSSASNSMPFLDPNKLADKEIQANTFRESATLGSFHPLFLFPLLQQQQQTITIANKLYVDSKLRLHHSFFSEPFASPQDLPS